MTRKAVLSNSIYLGGLTEEEVSNITKALTYIIPSKSSSSPPEKIRHFNLFKKDVLIIPIGRLDLIPKDYELIDKRDFKQLDFPKFKFELRPNQLEIIEQVKDNGVIIKANTSWGKTFCGVYLATKLRHRTLIVCHNVILREQWEKEIYKTLGIKPGVIGSGNYNTKPAIVVANIQTLYKKYQNITSNFGTIIVDEVHRAPSNCLKLVLDNFKSKYKVGLSATLERKDGKHVLLSNWFPTLIEANDENKMEPKVNIITLPIEFSFNPHKSADYTNKLTKLFKNINFISSTAEIIKAYYDSDRTLLVVAPRVDYLEKLNEVFKDDSVLITGSVKQQEREKLLDKIKKKEKRILLGTTSIFKEGVSINSLDTLILCDRINNEPLLIQLIGRILRKDDNKKQPIIVDISLKGNKNQLDSRLGTYRKLNLDIEEIKLK